MRLSTKTRYSLRAIIELALREGAGPQLLREIAKAQKLSTKYLEQLDNPLRNAGLLRSERGPHGGYELAKPAAEITALEIVTTVEGPLYLLDCAGNSAACDRAGSCVTRQLWIRVGNSINAALSETSLAELRDGQHTASTNNTFSVSSKSACHTGASKLSHVLESLGLPPQVTLGAVRVSLGHSNTQTHVERFLEVLPSLAYEAVKVAI